MLSFVPFLQANERTNNTSFCSVDGSHFACTGIRPSGYWGTRAIQQLTSKAKYLSNLNHSRILSCIHIHLLLLLFFSPMTYIYHASTTSSSLTDQGKRRACLDSLHCGVYLGSPDAISYNYSSHLLQCTVERED